VRFAATLYYLSSHESPITRDAPIGEHLSHAQKIRHVPLPPGNGLDKTSAPRRVVEAPQPRGPAAAPPPTAANRRQPPPTAAQRDSSAAQRRTAAQLQSRRFHPDWVPAPFDKAAGKRRQPPPTAASRCQPPPSGTAQRLSGSAAHSCSTAIIEAISTGLGSRPLR
jgi:hypothetical protein